MPEAVIGRVLIASLHQSIADLLPTRLTFYENWLNAEGMREGTIGLAPLYAVLSFLRQEGEAYNRITTRAGEYAAEWTAASMSPGETRRKPKCTMPRDSPAPGACSKVITSWQPGVLAWTNPPPRESSSRPKTCR